MRAMLLALALSGAALSAAAADWRPVATLKTGDQVLLDQASIYGPPQRPEGWVRFQFAKPDRRGAVRAEARLEADCQLGQLRAWDGGEYRPDGVATVRAVNRPGNWESVAGRPGGEAILNALCRASG